MTAQKAVDAIENMDSLRHELDTLSQIISADAELLKTINDKCSVYDICSRLGSVRKYLADYAGILQERLNHLEIEI